MDELKNIISNTNDTPTIVNNDSNFVVVTYWWGRNNLNSNTSRPCISYYEDLFKKIVKLSVKVLKSINVMQTTNIDTIKHKLENIIYTTNFKNLIKVKINEYYINIYDYAQILENSSNKYEQAMQFLEKNKQTGKTPANYEFKNFEYLVVIFMFIAREFINQNKENILDLFKIKLKVEELKETFLNKNNATTDINETALNSNANYRKLLQEYTAEETRINNLIKTSLNIKNTYTKSTNNTSNTTASTLLNKIYEDSDIQNKSLNEILIQELRYLNPLKFDEMIENWKAQCTKSNCNYMAVEYPQFAKPGGYQMAINAKPLFIKKSLELCGGKSVIYIDGDMNIKKYPVLFDLTDVDYMARGWWIDPRSSYKFEESIMYDPYSFETSGGTMFFSNSEESNLLLDMWISESAKIYQSGKADDRIISMIFNSKKMLLNMKIIQLPIEYLWLTLDYNERLLSSEVYDYNFSLMDSSIIIDHPECLTSEDTATGSGASNNRTPKFYNFMDENLNPVSETFYECLEYPDAKYAAGLKDYLNYMSDVYYIDDGNKILYEKGYVVPGSTSVENNEQPLYIYPYQKRFGNTKNELSDIIKSRAANMNHNGLFSFDAGKNLAEITTVKFFKEEDPQKQDTVKLLALMYKLLDEGKDVLYKPETTQPLVYDNFIAGLNGKYKNIEFAFVPIFNGELYNDIFRPLINMNNCVYISHKSSFMKQIITTVESLDDLSILINSGIYQLLSKVRVAYLINKKPREVKGGGKYDYETEYLDAMDYIEDMRHVGGSGIKKRKKRTKYRLTKHGYNKKTKKNKKY